MAYYICQEIICDCDLSTYKAAHPVGLDNYMALSSQSFHVAKW